LPRLGRSLPMSKLTAFTPLPLKSSAVTLRGSRCVPPSPRHANAASRTGMPRRRARRGTLETHGRVCRFRRGNHDILLASQLPTLCRYIFISDDTHDVSSHPIASPVASPTRFGYVFIQLGFDAGVVRVVPCWHRARSFQPGTAQRASEGGAIFSSAGRRGYFALRFSCLPFRRPPSPRAMGFGRGGRFRPARAGHGH
jgi:hypothetical protein